MTTSSLRALLAVTVLLAIALPVRSADKAVNPDEELLSEMRVGTDNASLFAFLRSRSTTAEKVPDLDRLIRHLGSDVFKERESAAAALVALEGKALASLRQAAKSKDQEIAKRAKECIEFIEWRARVSLSLAAVRVLLRRQPAGTVEALIRYLPHADEEAVVEEIYFGLDRIMVRSGKVDGVLAAALQDGSAARRALAACIVGRLGDEKQRGIVRTLLKDVDPWVRLRAAQGLLAAKDKAALPVLVSLLGETPVTLAWQAEELLHWVARESSPDLTVGSGTAKAGQKCRVAWETWWHAHRAKLDLNREDPWHRRPGLLLGWGSDTSARRVALCGCDDCPRWETRELNLTGPPRVSLLPGGHLLFRETERISERDLTGKVVWEFRRPEEWPLACRRLPSGNTLVVMRNFTTIRAWEVAPDGKGRACSPGYNFENYGVTGMSILPNGQLFFEASNSCWGFNFRTGDRVRRVANLPRSNGTYSLEPLPDGGVLVGHKGGVAELNPSGQVVWKCPNLQDRDPPGTFYTARRRNGNTLGYTKVVTEVARDGRQIAEWVTVAGQMRECLALVQLGFDRPRPPNWRADSASSRLQQLRHKNLWVRTWALERLTLLPPLSEEAVPALIAAFDAPDSELNTAADLLCRVLARIGPKAVPLLARAFKDHRPRVRAGVIRYFGYNWKDGKALVPEVIQALRDESWFVRRQAARSLLDWGPNSAAAVSALAAALKDEKVEVAVAAAEALGAIGTKAEAAVPALIEGLEHSNTEVAVAVAVAIGKIGPKAAKAIPTLVRALEGKRVRVAFTAAESLGSLGPVAEGAVPALLRAAKGKDLSIRGYAMYALGRLGPAGRAAVPFFAKTLLAPEYPYDRANIAGALGYMGPAGAPAVPALIACLKDKRAKTEERQKMTWALGKIGPGAKEAVPCLLAIIRTELKNDYLAADAAEALGEMGSVTEEVIPGLIGALNAERRFVSHSAAVRKERVRMAAVRALGRMGPAARAALPRLTELSKEKHFLGKWSGDVWTINTGETADEELGKEITLFGSFQPEVQRALHRIQAKP